MTVELRLLPRVAYRDQEIGGPRLRALLALLASDLRAGASTGRLVEGLWRDEPPENPTKALQVLIHRARAQLGPEVIVNTATGYRLALSDDQVDAAAIIRSAAATARHARSGDHAAALAHAEAGLALWDGGPDGDSAPDGPISALRAERASTYRSLVRARALALSRLGRPADAADMLSDLIHERPRDEEVLLELVRCEAATLGPAAALARYEAYRRSLRDALGTDPGPALQAAYRQLLQGETPVQRYGVAHEPNPLLGRDRDIAAVTNLLRTSRVTSIVGTGGLGKTRLAHVVSRQAEQRVVHFVPLAGVAGDVDVPGEVASVLGLGESPRTAAGHPAVGTDVIAGIVGALGSGPVLLVLDNCEHVLRGVAELVQTLVSATRELRVLTTSRAPLGLSSESVYPLPELNLVTTMELFGQRARAARPDVDLPTDAVAELCRHLDGLPLAVELAAARVRVMSVPELARRLGDRFALLRGGPRDAPQRHHTLHAVVDWSWNLLDPPGQAAMRALSVFPGGFTVAAAEHLHSEADVLPILEHLVDQSLLKVVDTGSGTRFRMLETVREFSAARRDAAGETDHVTDRFLSWVRELGMALHESPFEEDPTPCLDQVRAERDNLVHALRHGLAREDGSTVAVAVAVLGGLWSVESNYSRLSTLEETGWLLSHYRPTPEFVEVTRTALTLCTASVFILQGPRAVRSLVALRRLPPAPPDTLIRAVAVVWAATPEYLGRDRGLLSTLCDSDQPLLAGVANCVASYVWEQAGDREAAVKAADRMVEAFRERGGPLMRMLAHSRAGELRLHAEQGEQAKRHFRAALREQERLGPWADVIGIHWAMVLASLQLGEIDEAEHWLSRAEANGADAAASNFMLDLGIRAEIRLARGDVDAGLRLWRRTVDQLRHTEDPVLRTDPPGFEPWILEAQAAAVIAHAYAGRLDLVDDLTGELPHTLSTMLANPVARPPAYLVEHAIYGALLLALAMVDIERAGRTGDRLLARSGARLVALAERFHFLRTFQPTMSGPRARQAAQRADRAAYADAVSTYAALDGDQLRAAAAAAAAAAPPPVSGGASRASAR